MYELRQERSCISPGKCRQETKVLRPVKDHLYQVLSSPVKHISHSAIPSLSERLIRIIPYWANSALCYFLPDGTSSYCLTARHSLILTERTYSLLFIVNICLIPPFIINIYIFSAHNVLLFTVNTSFLRAHQILLFPYWALVKFCYLF
jgi:hypothetical protein